MVSLLTLFKQALQARENAYAPYSEFKVGAALLTDQGHIYIGANAENVSYPCGSCAEAGAISAMVAAGERLISDIVIVSDSKDTITPCGMCLQKILEFSNKKTTIHAANINGIQKSYKINDLLPIAFQQKDLKK